MSLKGTDQLLGVLEKEWEEGYREGLSQAIFELRLAARSYQEMAETLQKETASLGDHPYQAEILRGLYDTESKFFLMAGKLESDYNVHGEEPEEDSPEW